MEMLTRPRIAGILAALALAAAAPPAHAADEDARMLFDFADSLRGSELYKSAIPQFDAFLKNHPKHELAVDAKFRLADCHFQLRQLPQAIACYADLAANHKDKPVFQRSLQRLGHAKLLAGDLDGAIAALVELLKQNLDKELALGTRYLLGRAHYLKGNHKESLDLLAPLAADASPENTFRGFALVMTGDSALRLNRVDDAVKAFSAFIQLAPTAPERDEVLVRLGDACRTARNYAEAQKNYALVPATSAFAPAALEGSARSLLVLGKHVEALAQAMELVTKHLDNARSDRLIPSGLQIAGFCHYELKSYDKAAAALADLLQRYPKSEFAEAAAHKLCWCWYRLGSDRREDLAKCCTAFLASWPQSTLAGDAWYLRGEAYHWAKDNQKAVESYAKVPKDNASHRAARFMMGVCQHEANDPKKALEVFDALVAEFPGAPEIEAALYRASSLALQLGDFPGAEKRANDYLVKYPNGKHTADAVWQKAESLRKQGRYDEMAAAFGAFLKLPSAGERRAQAQYWVARAAQARGDALRSEAMKQNDAARMADLFGQAARALDEAAGASRECIKLGGEFAQLAAVRLAESLYSAGGVFDDQARKATEAAQRLDREGKRNEAAEAFKRADDFQNQAKAKFREAAEQYYKVIAQDPRRVENPRAIVWTGAWNQAAGDRDKAAAVFQKLLEIDPAGPYGERALYQLGALHAEQAQPDWARSLECFQRLVGKYREDQKKDPKAPAPFLHYAQYGMAKALRAQGKLEESAPLLEEVVANMPDGESLNASALLQLGHIQYDRGFKVQARDFFGRVGLLYVDPQLTPEALFWAGKATAESGEVIEGAKLWALLIRNYPSTEWSGVAEKELKNRGIVRDSDGNIKE